MPIDFYYTPASGPCRAILMFCKLADIELNLKKLEMLKKEHKGAAYLRINPEGTVPGLDDNGYHLWESRAILTYLADQYCKDDTLYPKDPKKRAHINRLLFGDLENYLKGIAAWFYPQFYTGTLNPPDAAAEKRMLGCLEKLDNELKGKKYLTGDNLTIADCSVLSSVTTLGSVDYDLSGLKNLHAYLEGFKRFSWYNEIHGKGIDTFKAFIKQVKTQATKSQAVKSQAISNVHETFEH